MTNLDVAMAPTLRVISLGAGVQSTTVLLLANHGELPGGPVDYAIFADTGWEPAAVYEHLSWLEKVSEIPIIRVSKGNLRADALDPTRRFAAMPVFVWNQRGGEGQVRRQCTHEYKIKAINRKLRELLGVGPRSRIAPGTVESLLGISLDEVARMKPSRERWVTIRWPLIELRMTRHACVRWLEHHGYLIPPKSSCIGCFAGETLVVTDRGAKPISSLVGTATLLVPLPKSGWASWRTVEVRSFGIQRLWKIGLAKGRSVKEVFATREHRWRTRNPKNGCWSEFVTTGELRPGDSLPQSRAQTPWNSRNKTTPSPLGIAAGFTFGDGERSSRSRRPATVSFYGGKYRAMLRYFPHCDASEYTDTNGKPYWRVGGLPRGWKDVPDLGEARGYLLGWLAGYFAADGTVSAEGQATMCSAHRAHLEFVRDVSYLLGVRTSPVLKKMHPAKGGLATIYSVTLGVGDLPESFWLLPHHAERIARRLASSDARETGWTVVLVEPTDRVDEVFCAVVPGEEMFVLADNLVTGNCPFHSNAYWREMRHRRPDEWADACEFDDTLRTMPPRRGERGEITKNRYLHRSRRPLREVDLSTLADHGQGDLFDQECSGVCGV